jgi:hypothetical protein
MLENITYSSLDRDDLQRIGDPNVIKIIKLQQLAVEYLMTVQHGLAVQLENFKKNYTVTSENSKQLNSELI